MGLSQAAAVMLRATNSPVSSQVQIRVLSGRERLTDGFPARASSESAPGDISFNAACLHRPAYAVDLSQVARWLGRRLLADLDKALHRTLGNVVQHAINVRPHALCVRTQSHSRRRQRREGQQPRG